MEWVMARLTDKVAVVTGAGSGIGKAIAIRFAQEGAKLCISDWETDALKETERAILVTGGEVLAVKADISDSKEVEQLFVETMQRFSGVHVLINTAGVNDREGPLIECPEEVFRKILNINLLGTWLCMKQAIPLMEKRNGGAIVNFSSIAALEAYKETAAYAASKAAVISLSRVAAVENAAKGIRVNTIAPGHIATPMFLRAWQGEKFQHLLEISPQGRLGKPEEIANVTLFLASDEASHVTASLIVADGGITARIP
jgi:NAD(P)-dependent dehydrogenase (short-subunit alcohol dehydrogenase family)